MKQWPYFDRRETAYILETRLSVCAQLKSSQAAVITFAACKLLNIDKHNPDQHHLMSLVQSQANNLPRAHPHVKNVYSIQKRHIVQSDRKENADNSAAV